MSVYEFFNVNDGLIDYFEYEIAGTNLIWQGDDLSTAVYERYNEIYDFWGRRIGSVRDGEIYDLSFKDNNTITAKCWKIDDNGEEIDFNEEFEYEPCDRAVLLYYEYMLGGSRQWRKLKADAPEDAVALVIVNPPERMLDKLPYPYDYENNALDTVAVISLTGDQKVYIEPEEPGAGGSTGRFRDIKKTERGRATLYNVTVPEGIPSDMLVVSAPGHDEAHWSIGQLNGRIPQMSMYLTSGDQK